MKISSISNIERFLIAASVALVIPLSAAAFNGHLGSPRDCAGVEAPGGPGRPAKGGEMMPPYMRGLNLTEAQRDKVFEIMHGQAPGMRDKAKALRQAEGDLHALAAAPDYSEAKARSLADAAAKAMADMALARTTAERRVVEVLTPEQRQKLAGMKPAGDGHRPPGRR